MELVYGILVDADDFPDFDIEDYWDNKWPAGVVTVDSYYREETFGYVLTHKTGKQSHYGVYPQVVTALPVLTPDARIEVDSVADTYGIPKVYDTYIVGSLG